MPAKYITDWTMEGTFDSVYTIVAKTEKGVVGFREIEDGKVRVRVEPEIDATEDVHNALPGVWKKVNEEDDNHCSVVVDQDSLYKALVQGFLALTGFSEG